MLDERRDQIRYIGNSLARAWLTTPEISFRDLLQALLELADELSFADAGDDDVEFIIDEYWYIHGHEDK